MSAEVLFFTKDAKLKKTVSSSLEDFTALSVIDDAALLFDRDGTQHITLLFHLQSFHEPVDAFLHYVLKDLPLMRIFLVSNTPGVIEGTRYLKMGVKGYGNSYMNSAILRQALAVIESGNIWIYPELSQFIISQANVQDTGIEALENFNDRDKEIILLVCQGLSNKKIASMLNLSEISIKKALTHIYQVLEVHDRIEMISLLR